MIDEPRSAHDPRRLPDDLPGPVDDGRCDHLVGAAVPSIPLAATSGGSIDLSERANRWTVVFVYPRTGVPGQAMPAGWDLIPGARGCTPQACAYRDRHRSFDELGAEVFGLSSQSSVVQREFAEREHLPFALLSDDRRDWGGALGLPTFVVDGDELFRRATLVLREGRVAHVRYPVFPPDADADRMAQWLEGANGVSSRNSPRGSISREAAVAAVRADRDSR